MEDTLKLIGSIKVGQKFYIKNDTLEIDQTPNYIQNIAWRWFTSTNRYNTIDYICKIIKHAYVERASIKSILLAKDGIENLMLTYKSDKTFL